MTNTAEELNTSAQAKLRTSLMKALSKIGHTNGHNIPEGATELDAQLHELYVAGEGKSYFDKRHKSVLEQITGEEDIVSVVTNVAPGTTSTIARGKVYELILKKNQPATRFDKTVLKNELRKAGVDQLVIDKAMEAATKQSAPAKRFSVSTQY